MKATGIGKTTLDRKEYLDMKQLLTLCLTCCFALPACAVELTDKAFLNVNSCFSGPFATFDSWQAFLAQSKAGVAERMARPGGQQAEVGLRKLFEHYQSTIVCENFDYLVDGVLVRGFYVAPKLVTQGKPAGKSPKLPLLIFNRGGNGHFGASVFGYIMMNFFPMAEHGFVVVGSQYRGWNENIPNSGSDEFGGKDLNDVLKLVDMAAHFPQADSKKIGMYGISRGGMMTYMAARYSPKVSAIAVAGGVVDLAAELKFRAEMENVYKNRIPDYASQKEQALAERSAILWADKIPKTTPILLLHGEKDEQVDVNNAKLMDQKLTTLKHPHKLVIYAGDGHSINTHRKEMQNELIAWFKDNLTNKKL
jgi:dipeptidyl aminopeptidase/acylaminoacyl peptidase